MNIHPIRTDNDYRAALRELSAYFDNQPEPGTEGGDRFAVLATLVEAYEARHFPIEAIRLRMEQGGLTLSPHEDVRTLLQQARMRVALDEVTALALADQETRAARKS